MQETPKDIEDINVPLLTASQQVLENIRVMNEKFLEFSRLHKKNEDGQPIKEDYKEQVG